MTTFLQRDDFAVTARVLGALFYYSPESHETAPLVQALLTDDWQAQWPLDAEALAPVAAMFKTHSEESLPQAWQRQQPRPPSTTKNSIRKPLSKKRRRLKSTRKKVVKRQPKPRQNQLLNRLRKS